MPKTTERVAECASIDGRWAGEGKIVFTVRLDDYSKGGDVHCIIDLYLHKERGCARFGRGELKLQFRAPAGRGVRDCGHQRVRMQDRAIVFAESDKMRKSFHEGFEFRERLTIARDAQLHF